MDLQEGARAFERLVGAADRPPGQNELFQAGGNDAGA